jgi:hypothetical protein
MIAREVDVAEVGVVTARERPDVALNAARANCSYYWAYLERVRFG